MLAVEKVYFFDERLSLNPKPAPKPRLQIWLPGVAGFFLVTSMALLLVLYLSLDAKIINAQYRIFQLDAGRTRYLERNDALSLEVQKLSALSRIERIARQELGMQRPKDRILIAPLRTALEVPPEAAAYHQPALLGLP